MSRIQALLEDPENGLHPLVQEECLEMLQQIAETTERIDTKTKQATALSAQSDMARRLQTIPGVGPMTALAVETFAPPMDIFKSGRDFAAWLGIVPRQHSSGGKQRLGKISKAGQGDIRRLLIMGAMTRLTPRGRLGILPGSWLARMLERKPKMLVAIVYFTRPLYAIGDILHMQLGEHVAPQYRVYLDGLNLVKHAVVNRVCFVENTPVFTAIDDHRIDALGKQVQVVAVFFYRLNIC